MNGFKEPTECPLERAKFMALVGETLAQCQLIEEQLKVYITESYALIRKNIEPIMVFRKDGNHIKNYALGKLVEEFSIFNENNSLIERLKMFATKRNELAHNYVVKIMNYHQEIFVTEDDVKRLDKIKAEAESLWDAVYEEYQKHIIIRMFDDIDTDV